MRIKFSNRGLTFSFAETDHFKAGTRYRYIVDNKLNEVIILPDENGKYKMSRKGTMSKPLVDLRNEEIRNAMNMARYMEVEVLDDKIVVHIVKISANIDTLSDVDIADLIDKSDKTTFTISKDQLIQNNSALADMLKTSGLFSEKIRNDISYVFDTVSLFSGAGGLDYPFSKDSSFDIKYALDFSEAACETYKYNIGDHIVCGRIENVDENDVPDADLIIGGICCQAYSNANRANNVVLNLSKKNLIYDYIRMVKAKKPLMFVIENVPQFVTKDKGKWLNILLDELSGDYHINYSIVNDSDVGGYTIRKRMILIGSIKAMGKIIIPDVELSSIKTVSDALKKVTPDWYDYDLHPAHSQETMKNMSYVKPGGNYKDIPSKANKVHHSNFYRRLEADKPAITITHVRKECMMPPTGNRSLTVAEASALMGFDKNFRFLGGLDDKYQQIANGVTQAIASFVKSVVKNSLYGYVNSKTALAIAS